MNRLLSLLLCALLLAASGPADLCAQSPAAPQEGTAKAQKAKTAKRSATAAAKARADRKAAEALLKKSPLSREDLSNPYSANALHGPPAPAPRPNADNADNASSLDFDPAPKDGPFAKKEADPPVNLRFGGETVVDPLTKTEVKRQPDAVSTKKDADIKGTLDKVGGKAEVQVDILKF
jgi:hypothetical protein